MKLDTKISNEYVLSRLEENKNEKRMKIVHFLKEIAPSLENDTALALFDKAVSIHQGAKQGNGNFLEICIVETCLNDLKISYKKQVTIDNFGIISGFNLKKKDCYHIIDFVIGDCIDVGKPISDFIVISCKTTCRERWTQDDWSHTFKPLKYILLTLSNDYPSSKRFRESEMRIIITCLPKKNDDRIFKLGFESLLEQIII